MLSALSIPYLICVTLHNMLADALNDNSNAQKQMSESKVTVLVQIPAHDETETLDVKLNEANFTPLLDII